LAVAGIVVRGASMCGLAEDAPGVQGHGCRRHGAGKPAWPVRGRQAGAEESKPLCGVSRDERPVPDRIEETGRRGGRRAHRICQGSADALDCASEPGYATRACFDVSRLQASTRYRYESLGEQGVCSTAPMSATGAPGKRSSTGTAMACRPVPANCRLIVRAERASRSAE